MKPGERLAKTITSEKQNRDWKVKVHTSSGRIYSEKYFAVDAATAIVEAIEEYRTYSLEYRGEIVYIHAEAA